MAKTSSSEAKVRKAKRSEDEEEVAPEQAVKADKKAKSKEEKANKKRSKEASSEEVEAAASPEAKPAKKAKKSKDADVGSSDGSEAKPEKKKKAKEAVAGDEIVVSVPVEAIKKNELCLDNFELSEAIKSLLRSQGIDSLFAIQAHTLPAGLKGSDVVGRARTGCGKTLGFTLPIVQRYINEPTTSTSRVRPPSTIVMAPTRELAKQVHEVFQHVGKAANLHVLCVYGGTPYETQENGLRRGTDVVVGTPGRIKDLMNRGNLKLNEIRFRVLDEVDRMLQMGFIEDVELILASEESRKALIQTYLFSATMPPAIKSICQRFLRPGHVFVDLIGDSNQQAAATTVRHLMLPAHYQKRNELVRDLITSYGCGGRTIVFTDTKNDAGALALSLQDTVGAQPIHGDLTQKMREQALEGFKQGRFPVLVATDVAARGLDVSGVDLVIMVDPPADWETYIHRSGRTGRAGHQGTCITLVTRKMEYMVPIIEAKGKFKYERIGAPQPGDMARIAAERAVEMVEEVDASVVPYFREAAEKLLTNSDSAVDTLARALAQITGFKAFKARSLLTANDDMTTMQYTSCDTINYAAAVWGFLKKVLHIDEDVCQSIQRLTMTADGMGAVFDVPTDKVKLFLAAAEKCTVPGMTLTVPSSLPELKARDPPSGGGGSWGNGYGNGYGNGGGRGSFGGRGGGRGGGFGGRGGGGRGNGFGGRGGYGGRR